MQFPACRARAGSVRLVVLGSLLLSGALSAGAAQLVVISHSDGGAWTFQEVERLTVNGKDKLRLGSSSKLNPSADEYKKLPSDQVLRVGVLRRHAGGYLLRKEGAGWSPVGPDGVSAKGSLSYTSLWSSAAIAVQKDHNAKTLAAIQAGDLFAVLPGADRNEAVVTFLLDASNFHNVGEANDNAAFDQRMSLLVAAAGVVTGQPSNQLQQLLFSEMDSTNQHLNSGLAHLSDLLHGLQYVAVSEKAYPNDERQKKARAALLEKKAWLDQRLAILKTFNAGELWDAFLDKYSDFERWDNSFDDIRKLREQAFQKSMNVHFTEGKRLFDAKQYALSLVELKKAASRDPASGDIKTLIDAADAEEARGHAKIVKRAPVDLTSAPQVLITRHLQTADYLMNDGKLKEAESEIQQAAVIDKDSTRVMISRAKLLHAKKESLKALATLDEYDRLVDTEQEVAAGNALRTKIGYDLRSESGNLKTAMTKAEADGDYPSAYNNAQQGYALLPNDLDFLLHTGMNSAIVRKGNDALPLLKKYLQLSQAGGNEKERETVYNWEPVVTAAIAEPAGRPNWFSGYKSPEGLFYCPISLMPNARVGDVKASRKQSTSYDWKDGQLKALHVASQVPGEKEVTIYFDYFKDGKAVRRIGTEAFDPKEDAPLPHLTPAGTVGNGKGTYFALLNYPAADPIMVERLTGKRVATIVSGNPYFHPFAWTGIYVFQAEYDSQGRLKSATQLSGGASNHTFDFHWDGLRLLDISERGGAYKRTMSYAGDKITSEVIAFQGKTSKIEYKYKGNVLVEADAGDDMSLDGRSRHVTFLN